MEMESMKRKEAYRSHAKSCTSSFSLASRLDNPVRISLTGVSQDFALIQ
jgi:hypothetical protein